MKTGNLGPTFLTALISLCIIGFVCAAAFYIADTIGVKETIYKTEVVDKEYRRSRTEYYTTTDSNGNIKRRSRHISAKYYLFIDASKFDRPYERVRTSRSLYKDIRVGDQVEYGVKIGRYSNGIYITRILNKTR